MGMSKKRDGLGTRMIQRGVAVGMTRGLGPRIKSEGDRMGRKQSSETRA